MNHLLMYGIDPPDPGLVRRTSGVTVDQTVTEGWLEPGPQVSEEPIVRFMDEWEKTQVLG